MSVKQMAKGQNKNLHIVNPQKHSFHILGHAVYCNPTCFLDMHSIPEAKQISHKML